jgi:uncharacterized protein (DUF58 family)
MIETLLQRVTRIPLRTWCRAYDPRLGRAPSRLRGAGMEFDQLKEYQEGDRIRTINWAATARRGRSPVVVNTYYEEKELTVMLLVDLSASMEFGSVRLSKKALAAEVSASLVYSALVTHNRVGFLGFTSQADIYWPPRSLWAYQRSIPEAILQASSTRAEANIEAAVSALEDRLKHPALVFLMSDFLSDDPQQFSQALLRLCRRHDLIALPITDPRESTLPPGNVQMAMRDLETGDVMVYRFSRQNRDAMATLAQVRYAQLQQVFRDLGIAHVMVTPQSDYPADLTQVFLGRRRRHTG